MFDIAGFKELGQIEPDGPIGAEVLASTPEPTGMRSNKDARVRIDVSAPATSPQKPIIISRSIPKR